MAQLVRVLCGRAAVPVRVMVIIVIVVIVVDELLVAHLGLVLRGRVSIPSRDLLVVLLVLVVCGLRCVVLVRTYSVAVIGLGVVFKGQPSSATSCEAGSGSVGDSGDCKRNNDTHVRTHFGQQRCRNKLYVRVARGESLGGTSCKMRGLAALGARATHRVYVQRAYTMPVHMHVTRYPASRVVSLWSPAVLQGSGCLLHLSSVPCTHSKRKLR